MEGICEIFVLPVYKFLLLLDGNFELVHNKLRAIISNRQALIYYGKVLLMHGSLVLYNGTKLQFGDKNVTITTLNVVLSVVWYLELHKTITICCLSHFLCQQR